MKLYSIAISTVKSKFMGEHHKLYSTLHIEQILTHITISDKHKLNSTMLYG